MKYYFKKIKKAQLWGKLGIKTKTCLWRIRSLSHYWCETRIDRTIMQKII